MSETPTEPKHTCGGHAVGFALASASSLALLAGASSAEGARVSAIVEPVADAYVTASHPRARHGDDPTLRVRGTPAATSYLRFDLTDEDLEVMGATLRLYARTSSGGVLVRHVRDDTWSEQQINAKTAPGLGPVVARSERLRRRRWIEVEITPLVRAGEEVSIALTAHSRKPRVVAAREAARAPELLIETAPEPVTETGPEPVTETAPSARTDPPILVSATGATLAGSLDSMGDSATYWFEYGPTPEYGSMTPSRGAASLSASQPVSEGIAGLSPATTYHYRLVAAAGSGSGAGADGTFTTAAPRPPGAPPLIAAAGDIACDPGAPAYNGGAGTLSECRHKYTSDLLVGGVFDAVLTLGDNQYWSGTLAQYLGSYDPTWGRVKESTFPSPGNHEYDADAGATGYFDYFNGPGNTAGAAGTRGEGYYSYEMGEWHLIALNSNCSQVGGCGEGSPQEQWLRADLAANPAQCTLAYWHSPRFSSGAHGNDLRMSAFWEALHQAGAELVLNGHEHLYERFAPQDPAGNTDPHAGIRQLTVGTGGHSHHGPGSVQPNSEVFDSSSFGVVTLALGPGVYEWRFVPEVGSAFEDSGSDVCH